MPTPSDLESAVSAEIEAADQPDRPILRMMGRVRAWVAAHPRFNLAYRIGIAIVGGALTLAGLLLLALPGPGWLTVFLGLAILGTEFHWARRIAAWLKRQLARFWAWWNARRARKRAARAE